LSFWWRKNQDRLWFEVLPLPGQTVAQTPSEPSSAWVKLEIPLNYGTNVVRWTAQKMPFTTSGSTLAYVDEVVFTPHSLTMLEPRANIDGTVAVAVLVDFGRGHNTWKFETSNDLRTWAPWTNQFTDSVGTAPYELRATYKPAGNEPVKFFRVVK